MFYAILVIFQTYIKRCSLIGQFINELLFILDNSNRIQHCVTIYILDGFKKADIYFVPVQARLVLACVLSPVIIVLGFIIAKEYHESGRLIFRTVGADSMMQGFCKILFLFLGLQKFDLQLSVSSIRYWKRNSQGNLFLSFLSIPSIQQVCHL